MAQSDNLLAALAFQLLALMVHVYSGMFQAAVVLAEEGSGQCLVIVCHHADIVLDGLVYVCSEQCPAFFLVAAMHNLCE